MEVLGRSVLKSVSFLIALVVSNSVSAARIHALFDRTAFEAAVGSTIIESFDSVASYASFKGQTVVVNDISLREDDVNHAQIEVPRFASGGHSVKDTRYLRVFLESTSDVFRINFANPVAAFGADFRSINARGGTTRDTVFTVLGRTPQLPTVVSAGETSFFFIVSGTKFSEVTFTRGASDSRFGLDNVVTAFLAPIPLSATGLLMSGGVAALLALARRRHLSQH